MTTGYAAVDAKAPLGLFNFERRALQPTDVGIEILYCGVVTRMFIRCVTNGGGSVYPIVPGHEIVGRVTAVGSAVKNFKPGQLAGVGCMVWIHAGIAVNAKMALNNFVRIPCSPITARISIREK